MQCSSCIVLLLLLLMMSSRSHHNFETPTVIATMNVGRLDDVLNEILEYVHTYDICLSVQSCTANIFTNDWFNAEYPSCLSEHKEVGKFREVV